jgi:two-component system, response regulator PdtaR
MPYQRQGYAPGESPEFLQVRSKMKNGKPVVLVVEDSALIRISAIDLVLDAGYEALEACNADEAIRILEMRDDIDLVFTDVQMPGTMDGIKLSHYIRDRWPPVRLIVASGAAILEESLLPAGSRYFPKPYDSSTISEAMARLLEGAA